MQDDHYRKMVDYQPEYDKVVTWIAQNNPAAKTSNMYGQVGNAEAFACGVVHSCLRAVMYGDAGQYSSTGMCIAIRAPGWKDADSRTHKTILAIKL